MGGALLQPAAFAENQAVQDRTVVDVQAEVTVGLSFDTVFETYIGPIPVVEGGAIADSRPSKSDQTAVDSVRRQLDVEWAFSGARGILGSDCKGCRHVGP